MIDDSLFDRTAELSSDLKQLKADERLLSAKLPANRGYETTCEDGLGYDASPIGESQQSVDELEQLKELRAEIWETLVELESVFAEFAKSEIAQLDALSEAIPGGVIGAVCSAAVRAVVARYVQNFGSLLSKNNNVAHLLLEFSPCLDPGGQSDSGKAKSGRPDVRVLRDYDRTRYRGVSANDQEVRFIDVDMAFDEFQATVLKAVEGWKQKRLVQVQRRAEVRKQLREVNRRN